MSEVLTALELERVAGMPEVERLTNLSSDTLKKHYRNKIVHVSPRRIGMRVKDALAIGKASGEGSRLIAPKRTPLTT
jgi:hypothetical protein